MQRCVLSDGKCNTASEQRFVGIGFRFDWESCVLQSCEEMTEVKCRWQVAAGMSCFLNDIWNALSCVQQTQKFEIKVGIVKTKKDHKAAATKQNFPFPGFTSYKWSPFKTRNDKSWIQREVAHASTEKELNDKTKIVEQIKTVFMWEHL